MAAAEWLPADWAAPGRVVAGTTMRGGGVSRGACASLNLAAHVGDDPRLVAENRRRFREALALPAEPVWLSQVHGTAVLAVAEDLAQSAAGLPPVADAAVTRLPDTVLAVLTADCLPVVLASDASPAVGVAHAGWRGLQAGVLEATVAALNEDPASLTAWLGPAISQPAFEVGSEVREAFLARAPEAAECLVANARGRWQADLYGLARLALARAGVTQVHGGGRCTHAEPAAFFSYRRDGECGRMATFVYRPQAHSQARP